MNALKSGGNMNALKSGGNTNPPRAPTPDPARPGVEPGSNEQELSLLPLHWRAAVKDGVGHLLNVLLTQVDSFAEGFFSEGLFRKRTLSQ